MIRALILLQLIFSGGLPAAADAQLLREQTEFIYQFTNYIYWPEVTGSGPGAVFSITVVGASPLVAQLKKMADGKSVAGRKIRVKLVASAAQLKRSDVVIVTGSREETLRDVARATRDQGTLVVSYSEGFARMGAAINFFNEDGRLRFEINRSALAEQKLEVSSRLLRLARLVN